jgi:ATP-dependent DNA helicase RecQ
MVMLGKSACSLVWPNSDKEESAITGSGDVELTEVGFDPELFERLKQVRFEIAKAENIPAYAVFPNKTLEYFTRLRPKSMQAGRQIRGVGDAKADRYLAQFVTVIQTYG